MLKQWTFFVMTFLIFSSLAHAENEYNWNDTYGFINLDQGGCTVQSSTFQVLHFAQGGMLVDQDAIPTVKIAAGTLVVLIPGSQNVQEDGQPYAPIQVLALPDDSSIRNNKAYAQVGTKGYMAANEFLTFNAFELMVDKPVHAKTTSSAITKVGNVNLVGSVWKAAIDDGKYLTFDCDEKNFAVFDVYASEDSDTALARVGVATADVAIFNSYDFKLVNPSATSSTPSTPASPKVAPKTVAPKTAPQPKPKPSPSPTPSSSVSNIPLPLPRPSSAPQPTPAPAKPAPSAPAATTKPPTLPNYRGEVCSRTDTDALKCMVCVLAWEANLSSMVGMEAVGETVMRRAETRGYPDTVCRVAYEPDQYVGLQSGKRLNFPASTMKNLTLAAYNTIQHGPGPYLDYRSCPNIGKDIDGNCFRATKDPINQAIAGLGIWAPVQVAKTTTPSVKVPTGDEEAQAAVANLVPAALRAGANAP